MNKVQSNGPKEPGEEKMDPITEPSEVPDSKDEKIDEDFPGYPHYPAEDDLLNPKNNTERVDVENISRSANSIRLQEKAEAGMPNENSNYTNWDDTNDLEIVPGTEADVTEEDLMILEAEDGLIGFNKEEDLSATDTLSNIDMFDMDMPGTELDDANEALGEEDEENNYYSLGAERGDVLEGRED